MFIIAQKTAVCKGILKNSLRFFKKTGIQKTGFGLGRSMRKKREGIAGKHEQNVPYLFVHFASKRTLDKSDILYYNSAIVFTTLKC